MGPLLQATHKVPIVFVIVTDPVGAGSLARPGGNATGFLSYEYPISGKWLELLKEIAPGVKRAAVIRDPAIAAGIGQWGVIQALAPLVGVEVRPVNVSDPDEIERIVTNLAAANKKPKVVIGGEGPWRLGNLSTPRVFRNCRRRCTSTPIVAALVGRLRYEPGLVHRSRHRA
jgi:ABC-type uncharacterized transport system substrate-binding protein